MQKIIYLILFILSISTYSFSQESKCKFIGYSYSESTDYSLKEYYFTYGYWFNNWIHKGFKDNWIKNKIYYLNLKQIEYTL